MILYKSFEVLLCYFGFYVCFYDLVRKKFFVWFEVFFFIWWKCCYFVVLSMLLIFNWGIDKIKEYEELVCG